MDCIFCGRHSIIHQRYSGVYRCDRCLKSSIEKKFRKTVNDYEMISPGDRVLIAVSGGKDSMTLMHLLTDFTDHRSIDVATLTIDEGICGYRDESLKLVNKASKKLGIGNIIIRFKDAFGKSLDRMSNSITEEDKPSTCTYCGVLRRSLLNQAAFELGADKLAVGHNLDDGVQTIMLNYIRGDLSRLSRLDPNIKDREGFVPRIKPLREIPEKEVTIYSLIHDFEAQIAECPYMSGLRTDIGEFLNNLESKHPTTKFKILRMFERLKQYLPDTSEEFKLKKCDNCGEPTPESPCRTCELLDKLDLKRKKTLISQEELKRIWW